MNFKWFTKQCVILTWMFQGFTSSTSFKPSTRQQTCSVNLSSVTLKMVGIDHWRAKIGSFRCRGAPDFAAHPDCDCMMCDKKRFNSRKCGCDCHVFGSDIHSVCECGKASEENLLAKMSLSSCDGEKTCEEDPVTKSNYASVIEDKLVRGGVETHPGPGPSNLVSTF